MNRELRESLSLICYGLAGQILGAIGLGLGGVADAFAIAGAVVVALAALLVLLGLVQIGRELASDRPLV
ncbi:MAG TPA: hypothetical protein VFO98_05990 [Marmoricola sp.]|jgi:sulfite exporter TauE/SafE|nr:hypothetical protein [Marmoricola sp.]